MDPIAGLLLFGIYKAAEKFADKLLDSAWDPIDEAIKPWFRSKAGKGDTAQLKESIGRAAILARQETFDTSPNKATATQVFATFGNPDVATALAEEGAKTLRTSVNPDLDRLRRLCETEIHKGEGYHPPAEAIRAILDTFLYQLHEALLGQEPFQHLIQKEIRDLNREHLEVEIDQRDLLQKIAAALIPDKIFATEEDYRHQVIEVDGRLDFTGMAITGRRDAVRVDELFAHLQLKPEVVVNRGKLQHIQEKTEETEDRIDPINPNIDFPFRNWTITPPFISMAFQDKLPIVVLGNPGSGKTTLLKYLAVLAAEGRPADKFGLDLPASGPYLPIFVALRRFSAEAAGRNKNYRLVDYFETQAYERYETCLPPGFIDQALREGRCLVLLDGLDEVWETVQRAEVRDAVHALVNHPQYRRNRFLITSRIAGYDAAPLDRGSYPHYVVQELADEDIEQFIRIWYTLRESDAKQREELTKGLIEALRSQSHIRSLARNPLLLTIIALVHRNEADLPQERVTLYQKCVQTLVEEWEGKKKLSTEEKSRPYYQHRQDLLELLAYDLHSGAEKPGELQPILRDELENKLTKYLVEDLALFPNPRQARPEADIFIHFVADRMGLLVERGQGEFSFPHLTFQEYLAARDIFHRTQGDLEAAWEEIFKEGRLHQAHWREVILLLLAMLGKAGRGQPSTRLLEKILAAGEADPYEEVLHRHLYLAASALSDKVAVGQGPREKIVSSLFKIIQKRPFWEYVDCFNILGTLDGDDSVPMRLLKLARDPSMDAWGRCDAAQALSALGQTKPAAQILLELARNPDMYVWVRRNAILTLRALDQTEPAAQILLELARDSKVDARVRGAAVLALGALNQSELTITNNLLELTYDPALDPRVCHAAARALSQLGQTQTAAQILFDLIRNPDVPSWVRRDVAQTIGSLSQTEPTIIHNLLALARDKSVNADVRVDAAKVLGVLGQTKPAAQILLELARDTKNYSWVRNDAARALGALDQTEPSVIQSLIELVRAPNVETRVRRDAAVSLGMLGQTESTATRGLLELVRNPYMDKRERRYAAEALGALGQIDSAAQILLELARDIKEDNWVRRYSAKALGALGQTDNAAQILLELARDKNMNAEIRSYAAQDLSILGQYEPATQILLELAHDQTVAALVRRDAAQALGQLGQTDPAITQGLLELARDENVDALTRSEAYASLKKLLE